MTILICLAALAALAGCAIANRFRVPAAFEEVAINNPAGADTAGDDVLTLTTWNVGYAGMGAESDFYMDLGQQRRPLSAALVDRNMAGISATLDSLDSDIFLFQEAALPSWITYQRNVLDGLIVALPGYAHVFGADIDTIGVPRPFRVQVGNAVFTRVGPPQAERRGLPLEPTFELGLFRKGYRMHILRIGGKAEWVIVNIHLSTFDSAEADVRARQVEALMAFATEEYRLGRHVVIGGDWNLRLAATDFPSNTEERFKFWIRDFPQHLLPDGWRWAIDRSVPTVRTAYQPYVAGQNYTLIIDGFLVSPNVAVESVTGHDLGFRHSDHQPVRARLRALR